MGKKKRLDPDKATSIFERIVRRLSDPDEADYQSHNLLNHMGRVRFAESESGTVSDLSKEHYVKGQYQFKYFDEDNPEGQQAFRTALNRAEKVYSKIGDNKVPGWVHEAMEHNDPDLLTNAQSDELYLANLDQIKGSDKYLKRILQDNDPRAGAHVYEKYHHTTAGIVNSSPRLQGIFGVLDDGKGGLIDTYKIPESPFYRGAGGYGRSALEFNSGGFVRPNPGRKLI